MSRIPGIRINKDAKGNPKSITIDLRRYGDHVTEILDFLDIQNLKEEESIPWDEAVKDLDKKFGIQREC